ncbi:unnamed protein product [Moneuplotes crassus]|uniref:Uncharacterized protein n=1 Tax=Euplotes crassus TaxID=5936 RepID=A0AAD1U801_EUPCR|nr:unnamed protein product [Moneuplotes crassus]
MSKEEGNRQSQAHSQSKPEENTFMYSKSTDTLKITVSQSIQISDHSEEPSRIQPKQVKVKGITRIINGPKKNAIVRKITNKAKKKPSQQLSSSQSKPKMSVYERLYTSKLAKGPIKPVKREAPIKKKNKKVAKKIRNNSAKVPTSRSRMGFSKTRTFDINQKITESTSKDGNKRSPTPVAAKVVNSLENGSRNQLSMSAKERVPFLGISEKVPKFFSENPSTTSHFSDNVPSHQLTELDDAIEGDLGELLNSIKKQNDELKGRIQDKRIDKVSKNATMDPIYGAKMLRVSYNEFQSSDSRDLLTKTMDKIALSPMREANFLHPHDSAVSLFSGKTEDGDFEREEGSENMERLDINLSNKKSEACTVREITKDAHACDECIVLKSCARKLTEKLRQAQKEIEQLKLDKVIQEDRHREKLTKLEKERAKKEKDNKMLNKKLLNAIVAIKQTLWSSDAYNKDADTLIYSLQMENMNLRNVLKLQQKYDIDTEELLMKAKESYVRSKSFNGNNKENKASPKMTSKGASKEESKLRRGLKRSKKSSKKRRESFDSSIFLPEIHFDLESSSNSSSQDFEDYDFEDLDLRNSFKIKALPRGDIEHLIEDSNSAPAFKTTKSIPLATNLEGYTMKTLVKEAPG